MDLGLTFFRNICMHQKGFDCEHTFTLFVNGFDWNGQLVTKDDIKARGLALDTLRGHWLARW